MEEISLPLDARPAALSWRVEFDGAYVDPLLVSPTTGDVVVSVQDRHESRLPTDASNVTRVELPPRECRSHAVDGSLRWCVERVRVDSISPRGTHAGFLCPDSYVELDGNGRPFKTGRRTTRWRFGGWDSQGEPWLVDESALRTPDSVGGAWLQMAAFVGDRAYSLHGRQFLLVDRASHILYATTLEEEPFREQWRRFSHRDPPEAVVEMMFGPWHMVQDAPRGRFIGAHAFLHGWVCSVSDRGDLAWLVLPTPNCCNFPCAILEGGWVLHGSSCGGCVTLLAPDGEVTRRFRMRPFLTTLQQASDGAVFACYAPQTEAGYPIVLAFDRRGRLRDRFQLPVGWPWFVCGMAAGERHVFFALANSTKQRCLLCAVERPTLP